MNKFIYKPDAATVSTKYGRVRGYYYNGNYIFKGIPYAKAKRFRAPVEPDPWDGVRNATNYGFVSPLLHYEKPETELLIPHQDWIEDEDCQNLNIWTPDLNPDELKPVFVWIHGGGFSDGSSIEAPFYEGSSLTKTADCVVVSINHRLNIFGYLDLSDFGSEYYNSGNSGMMDIIASLKWIKENIENFGGDKNCVTICGQSGGGGKVTALLQMPAADGLYQRAIIMSGEVALHDAEITQSSKQCVETMMEYLGISDVHVLDTISRHVLIEAYNHVAPGLAAKGLSIGCMPTRNKEFTGNPLRTGWRKESLVPLIMGSVLGEFSCFSSQGIDRSKISEEEGKNIICDRLGKGDAEKIIKAFKEAYPYRNPVDILFTDWLFRKPTTEHAKLRAKTGGKVYTYMFEVDFPVDGGKTPWHSSDISFVMHKTDTVPSQDSDKNATIADRISKHLAAFMRTGDPNFGETPEWMPVSADSEPTMIIGDTFRVARDFDREFIRLSEEFADRLGNGAIVHSFSSK